MKVGAGWSVPPDPPTGYPVLGGQFAFSDGRFRLNRMERKERQEEEREEETLLLPNRRPRRLLLGLVRRRSGHL
jgi:hypothetical protein